MGIEMIITLIVLGIALFLFVTEMLPIDVVAISAMIVLVISGVITPEEGVQGFANNATLTVAAMFVLSAALVRTNVLEMVGPFFQKILKKGYKRSVGAMALTVGIFSGFVNNTPIVATFIPIIRGSAKRAGLSPSKFLIPLSYVAILGGTCTLIGTSTNLLVSGIAEDHGLDGFSMFQLAPMGLILFAVGLIYLLLVGNRLLPEHPKDDLEEEEIKNFITEVRVLDVPGKNSTIENMLSSYGLELNVVRVKRDERMFGEMRPDFEIQVDDIMLVRADMKKLRRLVLSDQFRICDTISKSEFPDQETRIIEIVVLPNSEMIDSRLSEIDFLKKYQSTVLAIRQRGEQKFEDLEEVKISSGDILVLQTTDDGYQLLQDSQNRRDAPFLSMKERKVEGVKKRKLYIVLSVVVAAIVLATAGVVPIMIGAFAGIVILSTTGVITMQQAYRAIDWKIIFLLAGALSLGKAVETSGIAMEIAIFLKDVIGTEYGPMAVLSALYFTTWIFTEMMSNNAAAALFAPIGISIASQMGVSPLPFLMAVAFAGSASFMTPVGYQTNTMVYSAGSYRFYDFTRIGAPLNIIFWILATFLIPEIYPF